MTMLLPHGYCISWSPSLLWTNVIANAVVALSYFSIPVVLAYIAYKRKDFNFRSALILFSAFIISCGLTHVMAIVMIWKPVYIIDNVIMILTAILSIGTAIYLLPQIPKILSIPSNAQLTDLNDKLQTKVERQKELETILSEQERHYRALAENSPDLIVRYNRQGRRLYINQAFPIVTGMSLEEIFGKTILEKSVFKSKESQIIMSNILAVYATGQQRDYEVSFEVNNQTLHYHYRCIPELDETNNVQSVLAVGRDVTAYKNMESQLQSLATTDSLTGIANRRSLMEKLSGELSLVKRYHTPIFLLLLDLDHFKQINDSHGHSGGDEALIFFSKLIQNNLRNTDFFGRIGGQEFAIILHAANSEIAEHLANKLRRLIEHSIIEFHQKRIRLSMSVGITNLDAKDEDTTIPLMRADKALYDAKKSGRNKVNCNFI